MVSARVPFGLLLGAFLVLVAVVATTLSAGLTDAFGTNAVVQANIGAWSDGAAPDTFWDSPAIDVPGLSVFSVHCHGTAHYDFQYGATGPNHRNTCLAAMEAGAAMGAVNAGGYIAVDAYVDLPIGNRVLYRCNTNDSPWIYYIGDVISPAQTIDPATLYLGPCRLP